MEIIEHWFHEHPLRRVDATAGDRLRNFWCYGCWRIFLGGEAVYGCCSDNCSFDLALHEECAEMAREIMHPAHPSHPLKQVDIYISGSSCAVCEEHGRGLIYICSRGCEWWIHLGCTENRSSSIISSSGVMKKHPSHPEHELLFLKGGKRSCSFQCDACGTMEKGNSYACTTCDYWIHESCADLPHSQDFPHHHPHHSLSLAFHIPYQYIQYAYECAVCDEALRLRNWVYHCHLCRYVAHIKCCCATDKIIKNENIAIDDDEEDIMKLPVNDMYDEMIKPFVKKQSGCNNFFIPSDEDKKNMISSVKHKFCNHHHLLNFATFGLSASSHDVDDDDDGDISRLASVITCDACTLPIHEKNSSSDSGYMFCGECDYFLHVACFNIPPELFSHPLHPEKDHRLSLLLPNRNILTYWSICCYVCWCPTNGLFYACTQDECDFILDIKCASLPDTMKHAGHPQPRHFLKLHVAGNDHKPISCGGCMKLIISKFGYIINYYGCDRCRFSLCLDCVFLPASNKHRLEKHRMPLTYDASINHPSDFYCGSCEDKMNPKMWMYHCRICEESFHPTCFPATSVEYKNINFGSRQDYYVDVTTSYHQPHHPLKYQIITKKKHCDLCRPQHHRLVYEKPGFQCADCNFVSCTQDHPNVSITSSSTHNN